jgi:hypothetical protein
MLCNSTRSIQWTLVHKHVETITRLKAVSARRSSTSATALDGALLARTELQLKSPTEPSNFAIAGLSLLDCPSVGTQPRLADAHQRYPGQQEPQRQQHNA